MSTVDKILQMTFQIGQSIPMISIEATAARTIYNLIKKQAPDFPIAILEIDDNAIKASDEALAISAQIRAEINAARATAPPT